MKKCYACKGLCSLQAFNKDKSRDDGYRIQCRDCQKQSHKRYYVPGSKGTVENAQYKKDRRKARRQLVKAIKLDSGCVVCGFREHPDALQFDHLPGRPKRWNISQHMYEATLESLMQEIGNCEVVCANCHAIRTAARRQQEED